MPEFENGTIKIVWAGIPLLEGIVKPSTHPLLPADRGWFVAQIDDHITPKLLQFYFQIEERDGSQFIHMTDPEQKFLGRVNGVYFPDTSVGKPHDYVLQGNKGWLPTVTDFQMQIDWQ